MHLLRNPDDPRRRLLVKLLAAGAFAAPRARALAVFWAKRRAQASAIAPSSSEWTGSVNGQPATIKTRIGPADTIETGKRPRSYSSMPHCLHPARIVPAQSLAHQTEGNVVHQCPALAYRQALPSSRRSSAALHTTTATIGVRGTGVYLESDPEQTYFCTCYGITDIAANNDEQSTKTVNSRQTTSRCMSSRKAEGKSIPHLQPHRRGTDVDRNAGGLPAAFVFLSIGGLRRTTQKGPLARLNRIRL